MERRLKISLGFVGVAALAFGIWWFNTHYSLDTWLGQLNNLNPFAEDVTAGFEQVAAPSHVTTESRLEKGQRTFATVGDRRFIVYVPKGYDPERKEPYPVIYLLHGSPGLETDWLNMRAKLTLDTLIDAKRIPALLAVFPDGNGGMTRDTQYLNSHDGKERNADFIVTELPEVIGKLFHVCATPSCRAIGGLSSGAYGALNLGLKHQDVFGYSLVYSGYGKVEKSSLSNKLIQDDKDLVAANSPAVYMDKLQPGSLHTLFVVGAEDPRYKENKQLADSLTARGFSVKFAEFPGKHSWTFWGDHLLDGLIWFADSMKAVAEKDAKK